MNKYNLYERPWKPAKRSGLVKQQTASDAFADVVMQDLDNYRVQMNILDKLFAKASKFLVQTSVSLAQEMDKLAEYRILWKQQRIRKQEIYEHMKTLSTSTKKLENKFDRLCSPLKQIVNNALSDQTDKIEQNKKIDAMTHLFIQIHKDLNDIYYDYDKIYAKHG